MPIMHTLLLTMFQSLIVSLVLSRLDYVNAVLVGLPAYLYHRLQSAMNAVARRALDDALVSLHWGFVAWRECTLRWPCELWLLLIVY